MGMRYRDDQEFGCDCDQGFGYDDPQDYDHDDDGGVEMESPENPFGYAKSQDVLTLRFTISGNNLKKKHQSPSSFPAYKSREKSFHSFYS